MKNFLLLVASIALLAMRLEAADVNWGAGIDHGFNSAPSTELPVGSLVRIGWFRDAASGVQLTDTQIQALGGSTAALDNSFVEAGSTTIGSGFTPSIGGHFTAATTVSSGLNLAGKQMYIWVLNSPTVGTATRQAILYWDITDTTTIPDAGSQAPGPRWSFPSDTPLPGSTTIDLTDLTTGTGSLAAGARVVLGAYPSGTSTTTGANNFGLVPLSAALAVTSTSPLIGGVSGVSYSVPLTSSGGGGTKSWALFSGALPTGLTLANDGTLSGTPTATGIFTFIAQVTDEAAAKASKTFTLTIASDPLTISTAASLTGGAIGTGYSQALAGTGGTGPYTWTLTAGSLPTGLTLTSAGLITGTPTGTGSSSFTVKLADAGALSVTRTFSLNVQPATLAISTPSALSSGVINLAFSKTFVATGGSGTYTWTLTSGTLPAGLNFVSGVLSGTPTAVTASPSSFTLQVQDGANNTVTRTFSLSILSKLIAPVMDTPTFPTLMVSTIGFTYQLSAANYPKTYTVTGLPTGLTYSSTTGLISGRPTAAGVFMVQIKATNTGGTSPIVTAKFVVQALPTNAIGSFIGQIVRDPTVNGNLGGRIDLSTTSTGTYSLKVTQGSKVSTITGFITASTTAEPKINGVSGTISAALTLHPTTNTLTGNITVSSVNASVSGWRRVWNTGLNPASHFAGYYTIALDLSSDLNSTTVPQGDGYASFTVALDGSLTVAGKTSDGNNITCAGFVGANGQILVHQVLYTNLGSLLGQLTLTADANDEFTENSVAGSVTWSKPAILTSRTYPAAFGPVTLAAGGKYLARASTGSVVLGLPSSSTNAALHFDGAGIHDAGVAFNADIPAFAYTDALKTVITTPSSAKTTLTITPTNGAVSGNFYLVDGALKRTVAYQGLIVRTADASTKAFGYFLLPQIPTGTQTSSTSPIYSGQVSITQ